MPTRIKICGITRHEDALAAWQAGADALGFVFYPPSPRYVEPTRAAGIVRALPPFVTTVGLFVNEKPEDLAKTVDLVGLDLVQFHGDETPRICAKSPRPWIKAIRMRDETDLAAEFEQYGEARGILVDAYKPGVPGGTGETFDWRRLPAPLRERIVLAGGLSPDNITTAVRQIRPYAVDVSGGVEAAKGIKDAAKIAAFVRGVRLAES